MTTTKPSPNKSIATTFAVGMIGVKPAKTRNVASASKKAAPTTIPPKRPVGRLSSKSALARTSIVVRPSQIPEPKAANLAIQWAKSLAPPWQSCNDVARL